MRVRLVAAIGVAAALLPAVASSAQPAAHLTLAGSRSASVELRLAHRATLDLSKVTLDGGREFVGVYLETENAPSAAPTGVSAGLVLTKRYHPASQAAEVMPLVGRVAAVTLNPGRYR